MQKIMSRLFIVLSLVVSWFVTHRSQVKIVLATLVLLLAVSTLFAPQLRIFAEDAPGTGH